MTTYAQQTVMGRKHYRKFRQFHYDNPHIYHELVDRARRLKHHGRRRFGMKMLFEVLRWDYYTNTSGAEAEEYKLSNSFTAFYVRLIETHESDLKDFFNQKASYADDFDFSGWKI